LITLTSLTALLGLQAITRMDRPTNRNQIILAISFLERLVAGHRPIFMYITTGPTFVLLA